MQGITAKDKKYRMNAWGVSLTLRDNCRCICASGPEGAIAVGTPTERSGARSHAVGMDAEAPND